MSWHLLIRCGLYCVVCVGLLALPNEAAPQGLDFGWRSSNNAGGAAAGEGGGTVRRGDENFVSFYADLSLGGELSLEDSLSATGKIDWENNQGYDGDHFFGFFNKTEYGLGGTNSPNNLLGIHIREPGGGFTGHRIFGALYDGAQDYATNYAATATNGFNEPRDRDFDFTINYDPNAGTSGLLEIDLLEGGSSIFGGPLAYELTATERANGATFDAFGLRLGENNANPAQRVDIFFDDLEYTVVGGTETQSFDSEDAALAAGWTPINTVDPLPSPRPVGSGDFNADGSVDLMDYEILLDNFFEGSSFGEGDMDFDFQVTLEDFVLFRDAFAAANPAGAAVPEPDTAVLLVFGVIAALSGRSLKKKILVFAA